MFQIIFASALAIIILSRYYDWFIHKDKPNTKNMLMLILITILVIAIFMEKVFHFNM